MFTSSLPFQAVFSGVVLLSFLVYKLTWVLASLLITSMYISPEEQNSLQQYASKGLVGKFVGFLVLLVSTGLKLVSVCAQASLMLLYTFLPLIVLSMVFVLLNQRWGETAIFFTNIINNPDSPVGTAIHILIEIPLYILTLLAHYILPAYNLVVYIVFNLPLEIFVHLFLGNGASNIGNAFKSLGEMFPLFFSSASAYVESNHATCPIPQPTCWSANTGTNSMMGTTCQAVDMTSIAAICLDSQTRAFNFQTPLLKLRDACAYMLQGVALGCGSLRGLINVFLFPITDAQVWNALAAWLNAVMYVLVGAPTTTAARCALAGGFEVRPAMCTPDFGPAFDFGVTGLKYMGTAVDNFLDMAYLILLYGNDAECPAAGGGQNNVNWNLQADPVSQSMFGSNSTVLVSLSMDSLWAVTDGQNAMYIKYSSDVRRSYYPNLWGSSPVNPRYGIAALQVLLL